MPDHMTYYAVVGEGRTAQNPSGLARRHHFDAGGFEDEALGKDLRWTHTSAIVEWNRDALGFELVEISETDAQDLIARFREKWAQEG